jgi:transcriptional regulator of met regulon
MSYEDFVLDQSRMLRDIQHKMRSQQLAEAWVGIETGQPLLTSIVPDGERSILRKAVQS